MRFNRRNSIPRGIQMTYAGGLCFPLRRIANMDQTPLPFEYLCGRTYSCKGDKTIWAKSIRSGWDKRQATLVLTVFADGIPYVKPDIFLKEQTILHCKKATMVRSASTTIHVLMSISIRRGTATRELRSSILQRNLYLPSLAASVACCRPGPRRRWTRRLSLAVGPGLASVRGLKKQVLLPWTQRSSIEQH